MTEYISGFISTLIPKNLTLFYASREAPIMLIHHEAERKQKTEKEPNKQGRRTLIPETTGLA